MKTELTVHTNKRVEFVNITRQIVRLVQESGVDAGRCTVFIPHTTAAVTINEGADPDVVKDIIKVLNDLVPFDNDYRHTEGNSAAHVKTSMMGSSATILIENGKLVLGTWQAIFFCEFDGPRNRHAFVQIDE